MHRPKSRRQLETEEFDICIIGGGVSGAGCALDAVLRGYKVALIDKNDFAAGTSSRSTKLIHGGVRYLEQAVRKLDFGQLKQVWHGMNERHILLKNAPHLAQPLALLTPVFSWLEGAYFTVGLKMYRWFARHDSMPPSQWLSRQQTFEKMPTLLLRTHSSVLYYDGQMDDARYNLSIVQTAAKNGAVVANHVEVIGFQKDESQKIQTIFLKDNLDGVEFSLRARLFINCTGAHTDSIRQLANADLRPKIRPSKGVHVTLPASVLKSDCAMLIPKTPDGRVVFVVPFESETLLGTTDDDLVNPSEEPTVNRSEIDYLLEMLSPYLQTPPTFEQVKAGFGGLRPLLRSDENEKNTKRLLRDHVVEYDEISNLVSLMGGKWTTYRLMAKDAIDQAEEILNKKIGESVTEKCILWGGENFEPDGWKKLHLQYQWSEKICRHLHSKYGSNAEDVAALTTENPDWAQLLVADFPFLQAEVVYAARHEMVGEIRDFLARRCRLEILDWKATQAAIPIVGTLLAQELGWSDEKKLAKQDKYLSQIKQFQNNIRNEEKIRPLH